MSSSDSGSRVSSSERDSSGEMTEKNGFSVVAPMNVTQRFSTRGQQRVLLGLVEPVHLVDEQHGLRGRSCRARGGPASMAARTSLTPAVTAESSTKRRLVAPADHVGERGLAGARRPPQEQRHRRVALDQPAQRRAGAEQVPLADHLVQACAAASGRPAAPAAVRLLGRRSNRLVHVADITVSRPTPRPRRARVPGPYDVVADDHGEDHGDGRHDQGDGPPAALGGRGGAG